MGGSFDPGKGAGDPGKFAGFPPAALRPGHTHR